MTGCVPFEHHILVRPEECRGPETVSHRMRGPARLSAHANGRGPALRMPR